MKAVTISISIVLLLGSIPAFADLAKFNPALLSIVDVVTQPGTKSTDPHQEVNILVRSNVPVSQGSFQRSALESAIKDALTNQTFKNKNPVFGRINTTVTLAGNGSRGMNVDQYNLIDVDLMSDGDKNHTPQNTGDDKPSTLDAEARGLWHVGKPYRSILNSFKNSKEYYRHLYPDLNQVSWLDSNHTDQMLWWNIQYKNDHYEEFINKLHSIMTDFSKNKIQYKMNQHFLIHNIVLVHCKHGTDRTTLAIVGYLLKKFQDQGITKPNHGTGQKDALFETAYLYGTTITATGHRSQKIRWIPDPKNKAEAALHYVCNHDHQTDMFKSCWSDPANIIKKNSPYNTYAPYGQSGSDWPDSAWEVPGAEPSGETGGVIVIRHGEKNGGSSLSYAGKDHARHYQAILTDYAEQHGLPTHFVYYTQRPYAGDSSSRPYNTIARSIQGDWPWDPSKGKSQVPSNIHIKTKDNQYTLDKDLTAGKKVDAVATDDLRKDINADIKNHLTAVIIWDHGEIPPLVNQLVQLNTSDKPDTWDNPGQIRNCFWKGHTAHHPDDPYNCIASIQPNADNEIGKGSKVSVSQVCYSSNHTQCDQDLDVTKISYWPTGDYDTHPDKNSYTFNRI